METVDDPGIVTVQLKKTQPGAVGFQRLGFFFGFKVDQSPPPGIVGEGAPFSGYQRRVIAIFSRSREPRMFIKRECDFGLIGKARAFKNYFWAI